MKAIGIVFTTMWKHEVLKQAQVPARDQASARTQSAAAAYRQHPGKGHESNASSVVRSGLKLRYKKK